MEKKRRRYPETFKKESVEYLINSGKAIVHPCARAGTERCDSGNMEAAVCRRCHLEDTGSRKAQRRATGSESSSG